MDMDMNMPMGRANRVMPAPAAAAGARPLLPASTAARPGALVAARRAAKRMALAAETVDLTSDDGAAAAGGPSPTYRVAAAGAPTPAPGSLVAARRAKRLAREKAAAADAAAAAAAETRVDPARDPRRAQQLSSPDSGGPETGFTLVTKNVGQHSPSPLGWMAYESMPTHWGLQWGFEVPHELKVVLGKHHRVELAGRFKKELEKLPYKTVEPHGALHSHAYVHSCVACLP
jgi:hypothetical protein